MHIKRKIFFFDFKWISPSLFFFRPKNPTANTYYLVTKSLTLENKDLVSFIYSHYKLKHLLLLLLIRFVDMPMSYWKYVQILKKNKTKKVEAIGLLKSLLTLQGLFLVMCCLRSPLKYHRNFSMTHIVLQGALELFCVQLHTFPFNQKPTIPRAVEMEYLVPQNDLW